MFKGLLAAAYCENSFSRFQLYCLCHRDDSVALVCERTIPTERPPPVGEVSGNFLRVEVCPVVSATGPHGH